jgi:Icc-related predicted phosphoesterase
MIKTPASFHNYASDLMFNSKGDRSIDRFGRAHGDEDLLLAVKKIKPVLHICGHFHEG